MNARSRSPPPLSPHSTNGPAPQHPPAGAAPPHRALTDFLFTSRGRRLDQIQQAFRQFQYLTSPETLTSPTLRNAYDEAVGKMRRQFTLTPVGRPIIPDKVSWFSREMFKILVAQAYYSRREAAGACPYANICETCDNFVTAPEFRGALLDQLTDVQVLEAAPDRTRSTRRHAGIFR